MRAPSEAELLSLWESGLARHPIDRALLLCARARPDLAGDRLADLPLGVVNAALLRLRERVFGPHLELQVRCEQCGEQLAVALEIGRLLADAQDGDERRDVEVGGFRFRVPDSRALAGIADEREVDNAALSLVERCCIARPDHGALPLPAILNEVEIQLEAADPMADLCLSVSCGACGHGWEAALDAGTLLWDDVQRYARRLLGEVDALARVYGWTEGEVLALSPRRRAAYLDLAGA